MGQTDELERLASLRANGTLTDAEFEAQKSKLLGTKPMAKKASPLIGCAVLAVIAVVLVAVFSGGGDTVPTPAQTGPAREVTATELHRAYDANEAAAQQEYGNQPLLVSGVIDSIDLDLTDDPVVLLKTDNRFQSARAKLAESAKSQAGSLAKGQQIRLRCASVQEIIGTPTLSDCTIA